MKIINDILHCEDNFGKSYVAIGAFDGIHIGHRQLIELAVLKAKQNGGKSIVFTFANHPLETIDVAKAPKLINSKEEKIHILASLGVDYLIMQPFTREFSGMEPEAFVENILKDKLNAKEIFVGFNFSFGKGGKATTKDLEKISKNHGIKVNEIEPVMIGGQVVSSTMIRDLITRGELETTNMFLGAPFLIIGEVVHGRKLGRQMGFPTANLKILNKIYPPFGIYGGKVLVENEKVERDAVINIGKNPTLKPGEQSIEVHILDFDGDLYGKKIYVRVLKFLREQKKFQSMEELKYTINSDVEKWRVCLEEEKNGNCIKNR
ncbi:MAG: bifunctional riboflavin kinase/FAD synthetase [Cetobacterium sp.]|uniref:bifunctional riboflavin kinase/FAD synthetase n=1 Tax=unclassified Cetobacterium TaxID=2630983 RepID=UPI00163C0F94|nr:bifunctional riboflavin kinase/FAD synthetase [Cetobacterium sp. 2A]MBC2855703.1 bifunctional riboflavin kinase/FAD synthetase [Cetobacterium sp. 2A]